MVPPTSLESKCLARSNKSGLSDYEIYIATDSTFILRHADMTKFWKILPLVVALFGSVSASAQPLVPPLRIMGTHNARIWMHLAHHTRFPAEARRRGEQGTAMVAFTLEAAGRVTNVSLVRGSGSAILDREALAMVRRASPFPPGSTSRRYTIPVSFQ